ncbi:MAG: hypothetical protein GIX03_01820 [Candidatus Eremiobacteraeota bacterium]|nr:hypothetical protein [Candidatus Eremiobacteraeota bacterium]MBC5801756.1 hypothetical protein [Candidatus Eremiobacteraeota bacterium]MBC5820852.1 hypothetical protein [Candidatus Eremiobacteraeota bacterium]
MPIACAFVPAFGIAAGDASAEHRRLWERALEALDAASPLVEDAGEGTALLEMRGIAGDERAWLRSVREAFTRDDALRGLPLRVALGPNPFVARVAARVHDGTVVREGEERRFVAPLPLRLLELERDTLARLELLGIRTFGELAALPHGPFVRRFGPAAARWHTRACGHDDAPLVPRARRVSVEHALAGEGSAEREDQLLFALRTLVARVAEDVAFVGKRCGALRLELECEDGDIHVLATALAQPTAQSATMFDLLRARLDGTVLRSPVTGLRLRADRLEEGGMELSLFAGRDPDPEIVAIALARLAAALGDEVALRARIVAGNHDRARLAYEPFTAERVARTTRAALVAPASLASESATLAYRIVPPRRVDVRIRHGRPAFVDSHAVLECAGPWRVDEAWWGSALGALARGSARMMQDAYDVLLADGALCRIVAERGRWYVSGTYD